MIKYTQLTVRERYTIEILIQEGYSLTGIAERIGRHKSTISRENKRNSIKNIYYAETAEKLMIERHKRAAVTKFTELSKDKIEEKLQLGWTPEQISAYLKNEDIVSVSHELIYQYIDKDRKLGGRLYMYLPHRGNKYKKRNLKSRKIWKTVAKRHSISERPAKDILKTEVGHWEGDTVESKGHRGGIATFVDIKSKFTIIRKVRDKTSLEMTNAIIRGFKYSSGLLKTLTVDNGNEFAGHVKISKELKTEVYFATPYSPWERGLNENTNGLIRRIYPKGTDFTKISERELIKVQNLLNERPRKTLNFQTPKEVFLKGVLKIEKFKKLLEVL